MNQQPWGQQPEQPWGSPPQPWEMTPPPPSRREPNYAARTIAFAAVIIGIVGAVVILIMSSGNDEDDGPSSRTVTRADYENSGRPWPLTVDWAVLDCTRLENTAYSISASVEDGTIYALNAWAERTFPRIDPIWADEPKAPGVRISIGEMNSEAMSLCD